MGCLWPAVLDPWPCLPTADVVTCLTGMRCIAPFPRAFNLPSPHAPHPPLIKALIGRPRPRPPAVPRQCLQAGCETPTRAAAEGWEQQWDEEEQEVGSGVGARAVWAGWVAYRSGSCSHAFKRVLVLHTDAPV